MTRKPAFVVPLATPSLTNCKSFSRESNRGRLFMTHAPEQSNKNDGVFARAAIALFRKVMQQHVGTPSKRTGYDGLIDDCRALLTRKSPMQQREIVLQVLNTLFVAPRGPRLFRASFADKPGFNARITPIFFQWLVGPSEVNDPPEETGALPRTGVLIEKCRFLDESGCKGLCLNMCQQVSQNFLTMHRQYLQNLSNGQLNLYIPLCCE